MGFQLKTHPMPSLLERRSQLGHPRYQALLSQENNAFQQNDNIDMWNTPSDGLWLLEQYLASQMPGTAPDGQGGSPLASYTNAMPETASIATEQGVCRHQSSTSLGSSEDDTSEEVEKSITRPPTAAKAGRLNRRRSKKARQPPSPVELEQKREKALERNRIAASKCRKRKSQQLNSLQERENILESINAGLKSDMARVSEELNSLKTLLMTHKSCSITVSSEVACENISGLGESMPSTGRFLDTETSLASPGLQEAASALPGPRTLDRAMQLLQFSIYDDSSYAAAQNINGRSNEPSPVDSSIDTNSPNSRNEGNDGRVDFLDPYLLLSENSICM